MKPEATADPKAEATPQADFFEWAVSYGWAVRGGGVGAEVARADSLGIVKRLEAEGRTQDAECLMAFIIRAERAIRTLEALRQAPAGRVH